MLREKSLWAKLEKAFKDFERFGEANPFCIGIKTNAKLQEIISGTIDHIRRNNAKVLTYEIESWGRLAWLQYQRDGLQSVWENYGLVNAEEWLTCRQLILQNLEQVYRHRVKEYTTGIRRLFKTPIDSCEFEEQLLEDLIARTGDLPKVMYITLDINDHLFELITAFNIKLSGLGLKKSDRAILYAIDPLFYKRFKKSKPSLKEIEKMVIDLQMIFNADIYYYPGWDIILKLGVKEKWYKIEELYKYG